MAEVINIVVSPPPTVQINVVEQAPTVVLKVAGPGSFTGGPPKAIPTDMVSTTTNDISYVSPFLYWIGINNFLALNNIFTGDNIFNKGVTLGEDITPDNGQVWYKPSTFDFLGKSNNTVFSFITSLLGKYGRIAIVSKNGFDATGVVGNLFFHYLTVQEAVTDSVGNDLILVMPGTYNENVSYTGKTLTFYLFNATVSSLTSTVNNNSRVVGFGNSRVNTLSLSDDNSGIGNAYIKDLIIGTYAIGYRGTIHMNGCTVNNITGAVGAAQNIRAFNTGFLNCSFGATDSGRNFTRGYFSKCTFSSCNFILTSQNTTTYLYFSDSELTSCSISAYHHKVIFKHCELKNTTYNWVYSGAIPNVTQFLTLDTCIVSGWTFNNVSSGQLSYSLTINIDKTKTDYDFNSMIVGNVVTEGIDQTIMSSTRISRFTIL